MDYAKLVSMWVKTLEEKGLVKQASELKSALGKIAALPLSQGEIPTTRGYARGREQQYREPSETGQPGLKPGDPYTELTPQGKEYPSKYKPDKGTMTPTQEKVILTLEEAIERFKRNIGNRKIPMPIGTDDVLPLEQAIENYNKFMAGPTPRREASVFLRKLVEELKKLI